MHETPTDAGPRCATHNESMAGGRACQACLASPLPDEAEDAGFYETLTEQAAIDRLAAESLLNSRVARMDALAEDLRLERLATVGDDRESRAHRNTLASLVIKAHEAGGKDLRHLATMINYRERAADAERADRLYAERQRAVARERAH